MLLVINKNFRKLNKKMSNNIQAFFFQKMISKDDYQISDEHIKSTQIHYVSGKCKLKPHGNTATYLTIEDKGIY